MVAYRDGAVIIAGGSLSSNHDGLSEVYSPATSSWSDLNTSETVAWLTEFAAANVNGNVFLFGEPLYPHRPLSATHGRYLSVREPPKVYLSEIKADNSEYQHDQTWMSSDSIPRVNGPLSKAQNWRDGDFRSEQELWEIKFFLLVAQILKLLNAGDGTMMRP